MNNLIKSLIAVCLISLSSFSFAGDLMDKVAQIHKKGGSGPVLAVVCYRAGENYTYYEGYTTEKISLGHRDGYHVLRDAETGLKMTLPDTCFTVANKAYEEEFKRSYQ